MKKKPNYLPAIIGLAAAGAAVYLFREPIMNLFAPKKTNDTNNDNTPKETLVVSAPVTEPVVDVNAGLLPAAKKTLSPLGTKKENLLMDQKLELNDKGQEIVKLQQILNRIAKLNKSQEIKEDGNFGVGTQAKLKNTIGGNSISLREAYYALFAYWNAVKVGKTKDWFKYFYLPYFTDNARLKVARENYFKNNTII
jgi:peptidoglycan hydrolase-like protein with peptidoglycan-binding domain